MDASSNNDFHLDNAVPVTEHEGKEIRNAPFSLDNAVPDEEETLRLQQGKH